MDVPLTELATFVQAVDAFYMNAFTRLVITGTAVLAVAGVAVPWLLSHWQRKGIEELVRHTAEDLKHEIDNSSKGVKLDLLEYVKRTFAADQKQMIDLLRDTQTIAFELHQRAVYQVNGIIAHNLAVGMSASGLHDRAFEVELNAAGMFATGRAEDHLQKSIRELVNTNLPGLTSMATLIDNDKLLYSLSGIVAPLNENRRYDSLMKDLETAVDAAKRRLGGQGRTETGS